MGIEYDVLRRDIWESYPAAVLRKADAPEHDKEERSSRRAPDVPR